METTFPAALGLSSSGIIFLNVQLTFYSFMKKIIQFCRSLRSASYLQEFDRKNTSGRKVICTRVAVSKDGDDNDGKCREGCRFDYPLHTVSPLRHQSQVRQQVVRGTSITQTGESAGFRLDGTTRSRSLRPRHYSVSGVSRDAGKEKKYIYVYIYKKNK